MNEEHWDAPPDENQKFEKLKKWIKSEIEIIITFQESGDYTQGFYDALKRVQEKIDKYEKI